MTTHHVLVLRPLGNHFSAVKQRLQFGGLRDGRFGGGPSLEVDEREVLDLPDVGGLAVGEAVEELVKIIRARFRAQIVHEERLQLLKPFFYQKRDSSATDTKRLYPK